MSIVEKSRVVTMDKITALCKRRGFVFPGSDIYGGLANTWDYGPLGVELKRNVKDLWWRRFVHQRRDIVGLDAGILMHPRVWEASGHIESFNDPLVDCRTCKSRFRADHLIEERLGQQVEGASPDEMSRILQDAAVKCPVCGNATLTGARQFNMMFRTVIGPVEETGTEVYLRPETAQAMFVQFKNIVATGRVKLPFGIAQIGKAFRNEITPGNFIFRLLEFEQMEIEYFVRPDEAAEAFETWLASMKAWLQHDRRTRRIRSCSRARCRRALPLFEPHGRLRIQLSRRHGLERALRSRQPDRFRSSPAPVIQRRGSPVFRPGGEPQVSPVRDRTDVRCRSHVPHAC